MNLIMLVIRTGVVGTCNKLCNNMAERLKRAALKILVRPYSSLLRLK